MNAYIFSAAFLLVGFIIFLFIFTIRMAFNIVKLLVKILWRIFNRLRIDRHPSCIRSYPRLCRTRALSSVEIGKQGEDALCKKLKKLEPSGKILRNLNVPFPNGTTTEIDVVMLTNHGIFVFEYKNYHCFLLIPENDDNNWIRFNQQGSSVHEVYSPVRQNKTHIAALKLVLGNMSGMRGINRYLKSYVVLSDECEIRTGRPYFKGASILNLSDLDELYNDWDINIPLNTVRLLEEMLKRYQKGVVSH